MWSHRQGNDVALIAVPWYSSGRAGHRISRYSSVSDDPRIVMRQYHIDEAMLSTTNEAVQCPYGLTREDQLYARCYCEENVYKLCERIKRERDARHRVPNDGGARSGGRLEAYVVFISNGDECVLLFEQRAGDRCSGRICWDYHVILITISHPPSPPISPSPPPSTLSPPSSPLPLPSSSCSSLVYDLDSRLQFPCSFSCYARQTLFPAFAHSPSLHPLFRVIPASEFLATFASDRSHMRGADGGWKAPPPAWQPIGHGMNLHEWRRMTDDSALGTADVATSDRGTVVGLSQLMTAFGGSGSAAPG